MRVEVKGKIPEDPRARILAIEAAVRAICERAGTDPADGIMMLLTAAVHLQSQYSKGTLEERINALALALGSATVAADEFFKIKSVSLQ